MKKQSFHKQSKKVAAVGASMLVAAAMLPATLMTEPAFAATETRTLTWRNGEAQPAIPKTITGANGQTLTLSGQSAPRQIGNGGTVSQKFSETRAARATDRNAISSSVPAKVSINRDGYVGDIPRTSISYDPIYRDESRMDEGTAEAYGGTAEAATSALPATITKDGRTLRLEGAPVVTIARQDSSGPTAYKAVGRYTVTYSVPVLQYYQVNATYSGTLTKKANNGDWTMSLTYSGPDAPPAADNNDRNENENKPEEENRDDANKEKKTSYWINYFIEGTTDKIASTQHVTDRPVDSEVEAEAIEIEGYELVGDKTQKLVLKEGINEINFYYKQVAEEDEEPEPIENVNETDEFTTGFNNNNTNDNYIEEPEDEEEEDGGIPIIPIAIAGAVALGGIAAGIIVMKRRKKNNEDASGAMGNEMPMDDIMGGPGAGYDAAAMAGAAGFAAAELADAGYAPMEIDEFADFDSDEFGSAAGEIADLEFADFGDDDFAAGAGFAAAAATAAVADIEVPEPIQVDIYEDYEPQSQLIELILREETDALGNVSMTYDQIPKAEIEVIPSVDETIPTVLYLPSTTDENGERTVPVFVPADNAQYWIAIDEETVERAPSKVVILVTDDGDEIFRGDLADENGNIVQQIQLDSDLLVSALNNTLEEGQTDNIADELAEYEERSEDILNTRALAAEQREQEIADALAAIEAQNAASAQAAFEEVDIDEDFADFGDDEFGATDDVLGEFDDTSMDDFADFGDDFDAADITDDDFADFDDDDFGDMASEIADDIVADELEADEFADFQDDAESVALAEVDDFPDFANDFEDGFDDAADEFGDFDEADDAIEDEMSFADLPGVVTETEYLDTIDETFEDDGMIEETFVEEDIVDEYDDMLLEDDEGDAFPDFSDALPELTEAEDVSETFDSDFEKEMDDFNGFADIAEPDVDEGYAGEPSRMTPDEIAVSETVEAAESVSDELDDFGDFELEDLDEDN